MKMTKSIFLSLVTLLILSPAVFSDSFPLIEKASQLYARAMSLQPHEMHMRNRELGDKGQVISEEETAYSITWLPDGTSESTVLWSRKNGKDNTAAKQKEAAQQKGKPRNDNQDFSLAHPLDPEFFPKTHFTRAGQSEFVDGVACEQFDFTLPQKKNSIVGRLWISRDTGSLMKMKANLSPLPMFVSQLDSSLTYMTTTDGNPVLSSMSMEAEAGVLFIKKRFQMEMSFSSYR